jgi:hypothetical protein
VRFNGCPTFNLSSGEKVFRGGALGWDNTTPSMSSTPSLPADNLKTYLLNQHIATSQAIAIAFNEVVAERDCFRERCVQLELALDDLRTRLSADVIPFPPQR